MSKADLLAKLKKELLTLQDPFLQGIKLGLGPIESAFPNEVFPVGKIHEFINQNAEGIAASNGFIAGLLGTLMKGEGTCVWISSVRNLFPPALKYFGVSPDKVIFVDLKREKDVLWAAEEALKCGELSAVVIEIKEMNLVSARRLQLAVEHSKVTGFILRNNPKVATAVSAVRWKITPVPSLLEGNMPGVGFPRWQVELLKVRNGYPGNWLVEWSAGRFVMRQPLSVVKQSLAS